MRSGTTMVIIRSVMALLLAGLGVASLLDGRGVVGVLLLGLAVTNVAMTVTMYRRRRRWQERLRARGLGGPGDLGGQGGYGGPGGIGRRGMGPGGWAPGTGAGRAGRGGMGRGGRPAAGGAAPDGAGSPDGWPRSQAG